MGNKIPSLALLISRIWKPSSTRSLQGSDCKGRQKTRSAFSKMLSVNPVGPLDPPILVQEVLRLVYLNVLTRGHLVGHPRKMGHPSILRSLHHHPVPLLESPILSLVLFINNDKGKPLGSDKWGYPLRFPLALPNGPPIFCPNEVKEVT